MFWPLYPWERSLVPTEEEAVWAPEPVVMFWRREKSLFVKFEVLLFCDNMT